MLALNNPAEGDLARRSAGRAPHRGRGRRMAARGRAQAARRRRGGAAALLDGASGSSASTPPLLSARLAIAEGGGRHGDRRAHGAAAARAGAHGGERRLALDARGGSGRQPRRRAGRARGAHQGARGGSRVHSRAGAANRLCSATPAIPPRSRAARETMAAELPNRRGEGAHVPARGLRLRALGAKTFPPPRPRFRRPACAAVPPGLLARTGRMLASIAGDRPGTTRPRDS